MKIITNKDYAKICQWKENIMKNSICMMWKCFLTLQLMCKIFDPILFKAMTILGLPV